MSEVQCSRVWEAEAIEDGRLSADDKASFERHVAGCTHCANEVRELARLRQVMARIAAPKADPLRHHRVRTRLLRRTGQTPHRPIAGRAMLGTLAFAAAALLVWRIATPRASAPVAPVASVASSLLASPRVASPSFEVADAGAGAWTSSTSGGVARVILTSGRASFHVFPLSPGERFLVTLPDGEIEVHGTRFVVAVEGSLTRGVYVTEGVVAFRLHGQAERTLLAGDRWEDHAGPVTGAEPGAVPSANVRPANPAVVVPSVPAPVSAALAVRAPDAATGDRDADRFDRAMALFQSGSYAEADALLAAFDRQSPSDARDEDAVFVRAVAHARMHDVAGAADLAQDYLRRFPNGLRRKEAEAMTSSGDASTRSPGSTP